MVAVSQYKAFCLQMDRQTLWEGLNVWGPKLSAGLSPLVTASKCRNGFFIPQVGDEVYYFFQGHEEFLQKESCHFFEG